MNIAGKLRELRDKKGLTQRDLAKIIGITEEALQQYENVQNPVIPQIDILKQIAKFYKVRIEYLLDDDWVADKHCYAVILCNHDGKVSPYHFTYDNREEAVNMVNDALREGYEVKAFRYCSFALLDEYFTED